MGTILTWFGFAVLAAVVVVFLILRARRGQSSYEPAQDYSSDMILDHGQKQLYEAMKRVLLDEQCSQDDWRTFKFLRDLPKGTRSGGPEVTKLIMKEFKIGEDEASARLRRVIRAVGTVKKRHRNSHAFGDES